MLNGGHADHTTLPVSDLGKSVRFFVETLGTKLIALEADRAVLDLGDDFAVTLTTLPSASKADSPIVFFARGDFEETIGVYENRGIAFTRDASGAHFADSDGNRFTIAAHV